MLDAVSGVFPSGAVRRRIVRVATLYLVLVSLTLGLPGAARAALAPGESHREMELDGVTRHYRVWVPAGYDGSVPVPLVLDFHGFTSNDVQQALISGFRQVADVEGFIVIHPLGVGSSWNAGDLCCGQALQQGIDDVGFARAIVDATAAEANIDRRRVYATGLSNGGAMSHRIACEAADVFAASAPLAFPVPYVPPAKCRPSRPIAVMHFAGLTDTLVPYDGVPGGFPSAAESFAHWRGVDGCGGGEPDEVVHLGQSFCEIDRTCAAGVEVQLCSILGSPVIFPGHVLYLNEDDLDLARMAWDFLSRFTLPACGTGLPEDAEACEEALLTVECEGAPLSGALERVIRKKLKRAARFTDKAARAAAQGKDAKAAKLEAKASKQLGTISKKAEKAVDRGKITAACGATIEALVAERQRLIVGSPSGAFLEKTGALL